MRNVEERQAILNLYDNTDKARAAVKTPSTIHAIEEEEKEPMSGNNISDPDRN